MFSRSCYFYNTSPATNSSWPYGWINWILKYVHLTLSLQQNKIDYFFEIENALLNNFDLMNIILFWNFFDLFDL
jgi:hypothetical protein